jgi:hypothetical protein
MPVARGLLTSYPRRIDLPFGISVTGDRAEERFGDSALIPAADER